MLKSVGAARNWRRGSLRPSVAARRLRAASSAANAEAIAATARAVAERLSSGGRTYAFGRGAYATDAQHVAVEFVHPVLVGKPALPAADLSLSFEVSLPAITHGARRRHRIRAAGTVIQR